MKKYYVTYSGSTVVEAENEDEACELGVDNLSLDEVNAHEMSDDRKLIIESGDDPISKEDKEDQPIYMYGYDFSEGDKGVVIASSIEDAEGKIRSIYGEEYCTWHIMRIYLVKYFGDDVFCTEDTWK